MAKPQKSTKRSKISLESRGVEERPASFDRELGSSSGVLIRELVPELTSRPVALQTFNRMARTDAVTSVSLRSAKVPVLGADIYVDPVGDDQLSADVSEFIEFNIFEALTQPFSLSLVKMLRAYQDGFSVLEPVYQLAEWAPQRKMANRKQYTMLKKLAYRPSLTIKDIETDDNGGPVQIIQNALRTGGKVEEVAIPIEKAIIFSLGDSDDLYGESILRTAYQHWYYKTHLYKVDAIQKERHGIGVPYGILPPGYTDDDKKFLNEMLRNLRTNEKAEYTLPPGYEVGFSKVEGQLVDVLKSATYHDVAILLNVMAEFMMLGFGEGTSGGRATSGAQLDIFYKSEWFVANYLCDVFNMYLIPKLVLWNFETDIIPKLKVRNIGQSRDLQQIAAALANVTGTELITPDLETEQAVRDMFDLPHKKGERPEVAPEQIREIINISRKLGGNENLDPTELGGGGTTNGTGNGGQGNMGLAPTEARK